MCRRRFSVTVKQESHMAAINDLVLIHIDNKPGFYARLEDISPDVKPGWWQVKLLALSFPLQIFTWILDGNQIDGVPFTMGGTPVRIDKVIVPSEEQGTDDSGSSQEPAEVPRNKTSTKVVSLAERKKGK
jgi:hypothetical protein